MGRGLRWYGRLFLIIEDQALLRGPESRVLNFTVLDHYLHPLMNKHVPHSRGLLLQHKNASIHTSKSIRDWLNFNIIRIMDWPARCPDLNPIKNVWGKRFGMCTEKKGSTNLYPMYSQLCWKHGTRSALRFTKR